MTYETAIDIVLSRAILAWSNNCADRDLRRAIDVVMLAHEPTEATRKQIIDKTGDASWSS